MGPKHHDLLGPSSDLTYIGIDPGVGGAICAIYGDTVSVWDTPTSMVATSTGKRHSEYDEHAILRILSDLKAQSEHGVVALEHVQFRPGQDVVSIGRAGCGYGMWRMGIATISYRLYTPAASVWKREVFKGTGLGPPKRARDTNEEDLAREERQRVALGKSNSRELARRLYPNASNLLTRVQDHNRAEAILLAHWAKSQGL